MVSHGRFETRSHQSVQFCLPSEVRSTGPSGVRVIPPWTTLGGCLGVAVIRRLVDVWYDSLGQARTDRQWGALVA